METEEQIYFGNGGALYGVMHRPAGTPRGAMAVCNPLFEERKSAHRVLVEAARRFCGDGYVVLRFDYRGCGDSLGEFGEFSIWDWEDDIRTALARVRMEYSGEQVGLLGVRLGGTLAFRAWREGGKFLVMWAPVIDGGTYLEELLRKKLVNEMATAGNQSSTRTGLMEGLEGGQAVDFDGYEVGPRLFADLRGLRMPVDGGGSLARVLIVQVGPQTHPLDEVAVVADAVRERVRDVTLRALRLPPFWGLVGYVDCSELIEGTVAWLGSR